VELAERKRRLRSAMALRRRKVSEAVAREAGEAVARQLAATPEFRAARRVALYAALPDELPTSALYRTARAQAKPLLWPRLGDAGALEFASCPREEELVVGRYGVRVPPPHVAAEPLGDGDLVVVPGLAFDHAGGRLGRGGGHYDRAFPPAGVGPLRVGVGYAFQLVDSVPCDARDRRVDWIVTEAGVLRSAPRAPGRAGESR
jgi:5-formyltetrahydrofolate cyclo-ligase